MQQLQRLIPRKHSAMCNMNVHKVQDILAITLRGGFRVHLPCFLAQGPLGPGRPGGGTRREPAVTLSRRRPRRFRPGGRGSARAAGPCSSGQGRNRRRHSPGPPPGSLAGNSCESGLCVRRVLASQPQRGGGPDGQARTRMSPAGPDSDECGLCARPQPPLRRCDSGRFWRCAGPTRAGQATEI